MKNEMTVETKKRHKKSFLSTLLGIPKVTDRFWFIVIVAVFIGVQSSTFFTGTNTSNITKQIAVNGIMSVGMMLAIIAKGVDLSDRLDACPCMCGGRIVYRYRRTGVGRPADLPCARRGLRFPERFFDRKAAG